VRLSLGPPPFGTISKPQEARGASDLRVEVAGKGGWWDSTSPALHAPTPNELHLPKGQTVAFYLNAPDVIHSFWIPRLGGKRDVVPHRVNRLIMTPEITGEFPGQCAEYCGMSHANMRFRVVVHAKDEFDQWVKAQLAPPVEPTDALAKQGKTVFGESTCVGCHTIAGISAGQIGPNLTHFGSRKTLAANLMANTPENVAKWIENPDHMKPGARMPNLGMTGEQSKALAAYLLSLK